MPHERANTFKGWNKSECKRKFPRQSDETDSPKRAEDEQTASEASRGNEDPRDLPKKLWKAQNVRRPTKVYFGLTGLHMRGESGQKFCYGERSVITCIATYVFIFFPLSNVIQEGWTRKRMRRIWLLSTPIGICFSCNTSKYALEHMLRRGRFTSRRMGQPGKQNGCTMCHAQRHGVP